RIRRGGTSSSQSLVPLVRQAGGGGAAALRVACQAAGAARAVPRRSKSTQSFDKHRVMRQRGVRVDQRVEQLVVVRRREVEELADGLLLGPGVLPPLPFEGQDPLVAFVQVAGFVDVELQLAGLYCHDVPPRPVSDPACPRGRTWPGPGFFP